MLHILLIVTSNNIVLIDFNQLYHIVSSHTLLVERKYLWLIENVWCDYTWLKSNERVDLDV
jgi:hypothetical protein